MIKTVPDIIHPFRVYAAPPKIFDAVSTPAGLDAWWTKTSSGKPVPGAEYHLNFGPGYDWRGVVSRSNPPSEFELEITSADDDWKGTRVGFVIRPAEKFSEVEFHHTGWPRDNNHYRLSNYCWAMYLRLLKRNVEHGEFVPFEKRLDA